jgi:hypothetical protein
MVGFGHERVLPMPTRGTTMTVRKTVGTVGTLAQEAVSTAVSVAKHPIETTALAAGFVKGAAGAGIGLLRSTISGQSPTPASDPTSDAAPAEPLDDETVVPEPQARLKAVPERDLPGPDVVAAAVPTADELPEPVVIEAEPAVTPDDIGEAFHTEPKAASRDSEHGGLAGDREEAGGYVDEIPDPVEDAPVWTSETPLDEPLESVFDEAAAKTVRSEAEVLQKAADQHVE